MATIPVYMFMGFLESGKTSFLQKTLEDRRFQDGESTLVVMCEEGELQLETENISGQITIYDGTEKDALTPNKLEKQLRRAKAERVIIEYNGMWQLSELTEMLPKGWQIYQVMTMVDSTTFQMYNANMRALVVDKFSICEMVAFNRCDGNTDKAALHSAVRSVNRRADILFEYKDGSVEYDDTPDTLPYDLEADEFEVEEQDFGLFYLDAMESPQKYSGKTITATMQVAKSSKLPKDIFIGGRFCMTCCAEDVQFIGFLFETKNPDEVKNKGYYKIKAEVSVQNHPLYEGEGPIFKVVEILGDVKPQDDFVYFR